MDKAEGLVMPEVINRASRHHPCESRKLLQIRFLFSQETLDSGLKTAGMTDIIYEQKKDSSQSCPDYNQISTFN